MITRRNPSILLDDLHASSTAILPARPVSWFAGCGIFFMVYKLGKA